MTYPLEPHTRAAPPERAPRLGPPGPDTGTVPAERYPIAGQCAMAILARAR